MSDRHVIALIPARGGSKGIPGKNVRVVGGLPLIAHSIEVARATPGISRVYVSTDDQEIAAVARRHGAEVIERPYELANDTATSESALAHALDSLARRGEPEPAAVVFLQATSPRRRPDELKRALDTFWSREADSLFSATAATGFMWRVDDAGPRPLNYDPTSRPRRQDAPVDVIENGSLYIFKPWVLRETGSRLGGKIAVHTMPPEDSFQIDEPWDLELMDWLYARQPRVAPAAVKPAPTGLPEGASAAPSPLLPSDLGYFSIRKPTGPVDYESAYWGTITDPDGKVRDRTQERAQHVEDLAEELAFINALPPGRIVDVGCGLGFTLSGVSDRWEKHGVEVSGFAAKHAGAYGTIFHGELAAARYPDAHFDVVLLHHVIEHVDEPLPLMREALRILRPGGKLVLGTPDFDSAMARRFGERYRMLADPTHVSLFTNESMHRLLRDLGLVIDHAGYPYFNTRHFTPDSLQRVSDTSKISPAFYGNFMTFYCTKPVHADVRSGFVQLARLSHVSAAGIDAQLAAAGAVLAECIARGGKVLACGNGGSAADAQHFAAELVGRLKKERRALPAISLSSDPSVVTCLANDYGYENLFSRQVEAFGQRGDVLLAISTSGKSPNVLKAAQTAKDLGMFVISLTGMNGNRLTDLSDHCLLMPTGDTQPIQELHMVVLHTLCGLIDQRIAKD